MAAAESGSLSLSEVSIDPLESSEDSEGGPMTLLFWTLFVPVVVALFGLAVIVSFVFAWFLREELEADAAFIPPKPNVAVLADHVERRRQELNAAITLPRVQ